MFKNSNRVDKSSLENFKMYNKMFMEIKRSVRNANLENCKSPIFYTYNWQIKHSKLLYYK